MKHTKKQKAETPSVSQHSTKLLVSRRLSDVDKQRAKAVETICIGIVAKNMGYANQTLVCNAGRDLFEYISRMTYKQFSDVKRLANGG